MKNAKGVITAKVMLPFSTPFDALNVEELDEGFVRIPADLVKLINYYGSRDKKRLNHI